MPTLQKPYKSIVFPIIIVNIKGFKPRLYQEAILGTSVMKNTLVVLPTGMGKSLIFVMLAAQRLRMYPNSKILILAPTKPLCEQHIKTCTDSTDIEPDSIVLFTGNVKPEKREEMWKDAKIIVSTPQGLENDIINRKIQLKEVSLLVIDECHRAVKDYSYVWVVKQYETSARYPRIIGITASPGTDLESIGEVCTNLFIENIEIRTDTDEDVKPYIQDVRIKWIEVNLSEEFKSIQKYLKDCFNSKIKEIKNNGYINDNIIASPSKKNILNLQAALHGEIATGNKDFNILRSVSLAAEAMKVQHALELLETQGITTLNKYIDRIMADSRTTKVKATKNLAADINFRSAWIKTQSLSDKNIEHPKLDALKDMIKEYTSSPDSKIIVFNNYRDNAENIVNELNKIKGVNANLFVGQQKKGTTGLTQKKQIEMLDKFRDNGFNVLVATSVAEEGLDIPKVDYVIFYEPVPSAIRHIQRRGRTGRLDKGEVKILIAKGTRDEAYRWSAHNKEKRMYRTLDSMRGKISTYIKDFKTEKTQEKLTSYKSQGSLIVVDHREKGSSLVKELIELGNKVDIEQLESADFVCSERAGIEYKKKEDFINSIIDGRMLEQAKNLKNNFERPLIIIEGDNDLYSIRNVHPNAIQGMLAAITIGFGIPVIYTKNFRETASIISIIAGREQQGDQKYFSPHASNKPMSIRAMQEYIVSALPNIGPLLAKELLGNFGSVNKIMNASEDELKQIDKLGDKKARQVRDILERKYQKDM